MSSMGNSEMAKHHYNDFCTCTSVHLQQERLDLQNRKKWVTKVKTKDKMGNQIKKRKNCRKTKHCRPVFFQSKPLEPRYDYDTYSIDI